MKILITNTYYFPAFVGGAEISVKLLAEGLRAAGNEVYVLTTGLEDKIYTINGVIIISIKQQNIFNSYHKKDRSSVSKVVWHLFDSFNFSYHFKITSILKRISPDLVHTNSIQGFSPFLWRTIKMLGYPLVHSLRDYYMLCHKCSLYNEGNCQSLCAPCKITNTVKKGFFKYPDHFVAISNFILNKYSSFNSAMAANSSVIYNAVDEVETSCNKDNSASQIVFGYIGRVDVDKGVSYMVNEIAALPASQKQDIKLLVAGKGEEDFISQLKSQLKGVAVEFLGVVKPEDFYSKIDVLIVPALWNEPFGRIVIESISNRVPVCQSDRGGLKELFSPDSSWMFSPEETNLTRLLVHILDNKEELAQKKMNCVNEIGKFSVKRYISAHQELYKTITSPKSQQANKMSSSLV